MANEEHLAILKQGVAVWNQWRIDHPNILPDLSNADLQGANLKEGNLSGVKLHGAALTEANLERAKLSGADLSESTPLGANLEGADLSKTDMAMSQLGWSNLRRANLSGADMDGALIIQADLSDANLTEANLTDGELDEVNLSRTVLRKTNFERSRLYQVIFGDVDLSEASGLEAVEHQGPSIIGIDTIYRSQGRIPEEFLRGAGVPESFIEYMRSLVGKPVDYHSCFISYSSKDDKFARLLYSDLQANNVRCWFAPENLKTGERFWERIDASIRAYDKLLVILSEHSVQSTWVEDEVMRALDKEHQAPGHTVLFPIRLDDVVLTAPQPWAQRIRMTRHITNFTNWKNHDRYKQIFTRLLRDLKAEHHTEE